MKSMLTLSEQELKTLQEMIKKSRDGKTVFRAALILLLGFFDLCLVAQLLNISPRTLYDRVSRYHHEKENSFQDKPRSGRPRILADDARDYLLKVLSVSPLEYGYCWNYWTCRTLSLLLLEERGMEIGPESLRQFLQESHKRWKKPRYQVNSPDPEKEVKLQKIEEVRKNLKEDEVLLYTDESDFNLFCPLRNCWQEQGEQIEIDTPRKNQKIYAFGVYEYGNKRLTYEVHIRKRTVEFLHFLNHLLVIYRGKKVYLVLDNYCVHHAKRVKAFVERNKSKLEFLFLPTYAPQYNLMVAELSRSIERLWGTVKNWVNSNYLYTNKEELLRGTRRGLRQYQAEWRSVQSA